MSCLSKYLNNNKLRGYFKVNLRAIQNTISEYVRYDG